MTTYDITEQRRVQFWQIAARRLSAELPSDKLRDAFALKFAFCQTDIPQTAAEVEAFYARFAGDRYHRIDVRLYEAVRDRVAQKLGYAGFNALPSIDPDKQSAADIITNALAGYAIGPILLTRYPECTEALIDKHASIIASRVSSRIKRNARSRTPQEWNSICLRLVSALRASPNKPLSISYLAEVCNVDSDAVRMCVIHNLLKPLAGKRCTQEYYAYAGKRRISHDPRYQTTGHHTAYAFIDKTLIGDNERVRNTLRLIFDALIPGDNEQTWRRNAGVRLTTYLAAKAALIESGMVTVTRSRSNSYCKCDNGNKAKALRLFSEYRGGKPEPVIERPIAMITTPEPDEDSLFARRCREIKSGQSDRAEYTYLCRLVWDDDDMTFGERDAIITRVWCKSSASRTASILAALCD